MLSDIFKKYAGIQKIRSRNIPIFAVNNCFMRYNMKFTVLVFFCVCALSSFGQPKSTFESERKKEIYDLLTKAIANQDSSKMADGYYEMGRNEAGFSNHISSNTWYRKAMLIYKKLNKYFEYGRIYQRMAENEYGRKDYKKTIIYADSALGIFKKYSLPKGIISNYMFMLRFNHEYLKKTPNELLQNFDKMLTFAKNNNLEIEYIFLYRTKGLILRDSNPKAALESFERSKIYMKKYNYERLFTGLHANMAECYARIGQPQKARALLGENFLAKSKNDQFMSYRVERNLAEIAIFKAERNWQMAYEKQAEYTELQNEIHVAEEKSLAQNFSLLDASAASKSQERELLLQAEILKTNKKLFNILYVVGAVIFSLSIILFVQNKKNRKLAKKYFNISHKNELLIKEQGHRVKNNLQLVSSLISLQINRIKNHDLKESLEEMQGRIIVMSVLQQMLYEAKDSVEISVKDFFVQIVEKSEIIFGISIEKNFTIQDITIEPNLALNLGIILNELLTNSFKYAFGFDNSNPKIRVVFSLINSELTFEYNDNGKNSDLPIFEKDFYSNAKTFGLSLIRLKSTELNGNFNFEYDDGLKFKLNCIYDENPKYL